MKRVIVLDIKNRQEGYARGLKFIEGISIGKKENIISDICIGYIDCDSNLNMYNLACAVETNNLLSLEGHQVWNVCELVYCFKIKINKEDDIVNLMYFYLIRQLYKNIFAIIDTPGTEFDMKISSYLAFEVKRDSRVVFIKTELGKIEKYGVVHRLAGSSVKACKFKRLTKFLPLIEVTEATYDFLANTVKDAKRIIKDEEAVWENNLISICNGLFTQYSRNESEQILYKEEFVNMVDNVTVLTYILFCAFRNHCIDRRNNFEISRIEQELSDARDMAEGILQILENIVRHSQNSIGYFSFRIHDRSAYLNTQYLEYLCKPQHEKNNTFLEIFIADAYNIKGKQTNENILCRQFINNLIARSETDARIIPFIEKYRDLEVKHFFDSKIWKEYNLVSDNIIDHYGLQLFDKIVSSCDGCFDLISAAGYEYVKTQSYSSIGEEKKLGQVLPGTQYRVLVPIKERNIRQEYAGMDFIDYHKTALLKPIKEGIWAKDINLTKAIQKINRMIEIKSERYSPKSSEDKNLKEKLILELCEFIYKEMRENVESNSQYVLHFLLENIKGSKLVEIIFKSCMKALIRIREEIGTKQKVYIVFGKLSKEFITEFCYLMGIYYYKAEKSEIMLNTEMYFWDSNYCDDLLITGSNLHTVHDTIIERAVLRGIYPRWLNFVDYVWKKYAYMGESEESKQIIDILPYDVLVKDKKKTIFENVVLGVLQNPMEQRELGCLISNTHIQLESKIHISEFYNGQILFLNNYFTNYFSYLIVDKVSNELIAKDSKLKNITLVGYESYSEMLLVKTRELLISYLEEVYLHEKYRVLPYLIGEVAGKKLELRSAEGRFNKKNTSICSTYKNSLFIFIVPINSTMTTLRKMQSELENILDIKINETNNIGNYALILSRDNYKEKCSVDSVHAMTDEEKEYWKEKDKNVIITKDREMMVYYFIEVCGKWEKACGCKQCFPKKSIFEKPLIKTDITGLSPLAQLGEKRKWRHGNNLSRENMERVRDLTKVLSYNHIKRGNNHYLYYFDTTTYFYNNQKKIHDWIRSISQNGEKYRGYNFIVSPLHDTNAGFTEAVSKSLFNNTAHIIRLNFNKTYRSNFIQQFSYLQILYCNVIQSPIVNERNTEINFYFVDDEVISGKTLIRAKSLIEGLFENLPKKKNVKVNIFKKIIVLINRLSDDTKHNYINDTKDFVSYVNYNISVIQNHDDFCFMCKLVDRANGYKFMSATNEMDLAWGRVEEKFRVKDYTLAEMDKNYKQDKYKKRMLAAHFAEAEMWKLSVNADVKEYFGVMIDKLFYTRLSKSKGMIVLSENNKNVFISYIKILSRPFFVYRSRAKESALHILISFAESLLGVSFECLWKQLCDVIDVKEMNIEGQMKMVCEFVAKWGKELDETAYGLLLDILEQLADMESGYIVRRANIIRILEFYNRIAEKKYSKLLGGEEKTEENKAYLEQMKKEKNSFELSYILFIKQIINGDAGQTKSLWVENLFLHGFELTSEMDDISSYFRDFCGYEARFGRNILIENTKIVYEGIKYLAESISEDDWKNYENKLISEKREYFELEQILDTAIEFELQQAYEAQLSYLYKILSFYHLENDYKKIKLEVQFYGLMFPVKTESIPFESFYRELYWIICEMTGAEVQLLMIPKGDYSDDNLLFSDSPCIIYDRREEINKDRIIKLQDKPLIGSAELRDLEYEFDTYYIYDNLKKVVIKYSISLKHKNEKDNIYMILEYPQKKEVISILFDIRMILLCRSRTITRMKRDFNNNLFESLWQTKKYSMLLEHFKNVSHVNPYGKNAISRTINYIWDIEEACKQNENNMENGLRIYKGVLLKMLADNSISSIYHQILTKRLLGEYIRDTSFNVGNVFSDIDIFRYILHEKKYEICEEGVLKLESDLPTVEIEKNVLDSYMYYLAPDSFASHFMIISFIQNAYRHGNNTKNIRVYKEEAEISGVKGVDYLCISNGVEVSDLEEFKFRLEEHINNPIMSRKAYGSNKKDGITLFSANKYCQKIIERLYQVQNKDSIKEGVSRHENKGRAIQYQVIDEIIVFKIPILKGEV